MPPGRTIHPPSHCCQCPSGPLQATLAEAEAADGERKALGEQLAAATKAAKELEKEVGGWQGRVGLGGMKGPRLSQQPDSCMFA